VPKLCQTPSVDPRLTLAAPKLRPCSLACRSPTSSLKFIAANPAAMAPPNGGVFTLQLRFSFLC